MKLNLGAGYEHLGPEWHTVDLDPATDPDHLGDVRFLPEDWTSRFTEIRAVDILEHLSYRDTVPALKEWARVLKSGGQLFLQVPAADKMMDLWLSATMFDRDTRMYQGTWYVHDAQDKLAAGTGPLEKAMGDEDLPIMVRLAWRLLGGHYDGQYTRSSDKWYLNAHHALFDEETIRWAAEEAGLRVESIDVNPHPNYLVWLVKP
jgi:hypothetical protein